MRQAAHRAFGLGRSLELREQEDPQGRGKCFGEVQKRASLRRGCGYLSFALGMEVRLPKLVCTMPRLHDQDRGWKRGLAGCHLRSRGFGVLMSLGFVVAAPI